MFKAKHISRAWQAPEGSVMALGGEGSPCDTGALAVPSDTEAHISPPRPGKAALPCAAGCSRKHEVPSKRKQ